MLSPSGEREHAREREGARERASDRERDLREREREKHANTKFDSESALEEVGDIYDFFAFFHSLYCNLVFIITHHLSLLRLQQFVSALVMRGRRVIYLRAQCVFFIVGNSSDSLEWKFFREILVAVTYFVQVENFIVTYFIQVENFLCLNLILRFTAYSWSARKPMIFLSTFIFKSQDPTLLSFPRNCLQSEKICIEILIYIFTYSTPSLSLGDQPRVLRKVILDETELYAW
jgi:hypothetical protein